MQNDRKSAIIYLDWSDIRLTMPDIVDHYWDTRIINFNGGLQSLTECLILILFLD